ncbi:Protein of unknown function [Pyronema omphalodes CBS 100304]|uniref:Uncharacterized protein n=1 Tax=Pyronema omphalodes (strain CBS 100304) TaxID=1076935 RepID=U4LCA9_PYROM|nr:Protein of unknown function [Pyronema omphalodes CBS 100304]
MARRCVAWAPSFISAVSTPLRNLCAPHLAYLPSWSRRRSHSTHPPPSPLVLGAVPLVPLPLVRQSSRDNRSNSL